MNTRHYNHYSKQDIIDGASKVKSLSSLLRLLGLKVAGGNFDNIKRKLQQLKVNTDHWTGKAWNKNERLKDWSEYKEVIQLKKHLLKEKGRQCNQCKRKKWLEKPIPIEIHHLDGNKTNNNLENLELLCPNCHALTDNYKGKKNKLNLDQKSDIKRKNQKSNIKRKKTHWNLKLCKDCKCIISRKSIRCKSCSAKQQSTKIIWPSIEELKERLKKGNYSKLGKELGVSDNAIRKHFKRHAGSNPALGTK